MSELFGKYFMLIYSLIVSENVELSIDLCSIIITVKKRLIILCWLFVNLGETRFVMLPCIISYQTETHILY